MLFSSSHVISQSYWDRDVGPPGAEPHRRDPGVVGGVEATEGAAPDVSMEEKQVKPHRVVERYWKEDFNGI